MFRELVEISLKHIRRNMIAPLLRPWKTTTGLNVTSIQYRSVSMWSICLVFCHVSTVHLLEKSMPGITHLTSFPSIRYYLVSFPNLNFPEFWFDNSFQIVNTSCPDHVLPPTEDLPQKQEDKGMWISRHFRLPPLLSTWPSTFASL